jgi:hypothetical protein
VPFAYLVEPLLFETIWPLLLMVLQPVSHSFWIGAACLFLQIECNLALHAFKFKDRGAWMSMPWFFIKDLMAPFIWVAGLVSNKVIWRGQTLYLRFGGKLGSTRFSRRFVRRLIS